MEEKQLDFRQPLLSVRKREPTAPALKSEVAASVPFMWEKSPGRAKDEAFFIPTLDVKAVKRIDSGVESHGDVSRTNSFFINCSISGLSGLDGQPRSFRMDSDTVDFMIRRFLPAAEALASENPHLIRKNRGSSRVFLSKSLSARDSFRLQVNELNRNEEAPSFVKKCGCFPRLRLLRRQSKTSSQPAKVFTSFRDLLAMDKMEWESDSIRTVLVDCEEKQQPEVSLASLPLPESPSESWLRRTLPTVSSNRTPTRFTSR